MLVIDIYGSQQTQDGCFLLEWRDEERHADFSSKEVSKSVLEMMANFTNSAILMDI